MNRFLLAYVTEFAARLARGFAPVLRDRALLAHTRPRRRPRA